MSADNWAVCPRCLRRARHGHDQEVARIMDSYGKVPVAEFDAARAAIEDVDEETFCTFREDYEIYGAEEGEITVSYSGSCSTCGLGTSFKESRRFWSPDDEEVT